MATGRFAATTHHNRSRTIKKRQVREEEPKGGAALPAQGRIVRFRKTAAVIQVWFEGDTAALAWVAVEASLRKPFVKSRTARSRLS